MRLENKLEKLNKYPLHMPGHKRNEMFNLPSSNIDITEIDGFDNLHCPTNILKDLEDELTSIYESEKSFALVGGSTLGILCAIHSVCNKNDKIIISRNCHKSVYNACYLLELDITYIESEISQDLGVYTRISQENLDKAISFSPNAKAVVITSPTYEGYISNIKTDIPLIVDSAHGAHFSLAKWLPKRQMGDIVVSSLHKTLPSLTQTAVINVYNEKYIDDVKKYIDIFETSSPSYVLLSSISKCCKFIKDTSLFDELKLMLDDLYTAQLNHLKFVISDDYSRVNISTINTNINGYELSKMLSSYDFEAEMASLYGIILIITIGDKKESINKLKTALEEIDKKLAYNKNKLIFPTLPLKSENLFEIINTNKTSFNESIGKICGEYVFAYPPGIPIFVPGEVIDEKNAGLIKDMIKCGGNIITNSNLLPDYILTKA